MVSKKRGRILVGIVFSLVVYLLMRYLTGVFHIGEDGGMESRIVTLVNIIVPFSILMFSTRGLFFTGKGGRQ